MKIQLFFSIIDLFKVPSLLYFNGSRKNSSSFGIIFSLGLISYLIYQFFTSDIFLKKNANIITQSIETLTAERITFDKNHLFTIHIDGSGRTSMVDPSLITATVAKWSWSTNDQGIVNAEIQPLYLRPCILDDMPYNPTLFTELGLNTSLCLNESIWIEGSQSEKNSSFLNIQIIPCNNMTYANKCKTPDEINNFISTGSGLVFGGIRYYSSIVDVGDYENPIKSNVHSEQHPLDSKLRKSDQLYLNPTKVHTDDSWLFGNDKLQESYKHNYKDSDFTIIANFGEPYLEFNMFSYPMNDVNNRTYEKLPTVLANLTGMANMIMILCFVITNLSNNLNALKLVLNELYTFPNIKKKDEGKSDKSDEKNSDLGKSQRNSIMLNQNERKSIMFEKIDINPCDVIIKETTKNKVNFSTKLNMEKSINAASMNIIKIPLETGRIEDVKPKDESFYLENFSKDDIHEKDDYKGDKEKNIKNDNILQKSTVSKSPTKISRNLSTKRITRQFTQVREKAYNFIKDRLKENDENDENKLNMGFIEYVKFKLLGLFGSRSYKHRLIQKAEEKFIEEMDIVRLLNKLHEIEKLKLLLLDEDQLVLFEIITKPIFTVDEEINEMSDSKEMTKSQKENKKLDKIIRSYKNLQDQSKQNAINERLFRLIDEKIRKLQKE